MPSRRLASIGLALACLTAGSALAQQDAAAPAEPMPVVIGLAVPMSGFLQPFGQRSAKAAMAAVDAINQAGGIDRGNEPPLLLTVQEADAGLDAAAATAAVEALDAAQAIAVIGAYSSRLTMATTLAAERAGLPHLVDSAIGDAILGRELTTAFRFGPSYAMLREKLAEVIVAHAKSDAAGPIVIVHDQGPFGSKVADDLTEDLAEEEIAVAAALPHPPLLDKPAALAEAVRAAAPAVVVSLAYVDAQMALLRALAARDAMPPLWVSLMGPLSTAPEAAAAVAELGANWVEVTAWPDLAGEGAQALAQGFARAGLPLTADAALTFEAVRLVADALAAVKTVDRQSLRDALLASDFDEHAFGSDAVDFDETGQNANASAVAVRLVDGVLTVIEDDEAPAAAPVPAAGPAPAPAPAAE